MTSTEISRLLDDICGDNDYVFAFQTTQEVRDLVVEIRRIVALTNITDREWQSTDLEPLLGCLTAFIGDLDISISREKTLIYENKNKNPSESGSGEPEDDGSGSGSEYLQSYYDNEHISYLEDIKCGAVKSRDRVVEWQLMMIKKVFP